MSHSQIAGGHRPPLQFESFVARNKILVTIRIDRELSGSFKVSNVTKVGVVAYDPKVVTIWEGIKDYFTANHVYVKVHRRTEGKCGVLAMRDTDVGFTSKIIARAGSGIESIRDLKGKRFALGSRDSGQAAILPEYFLKQNG